MTAAPVSEAAQICSPDTPRTSMLRAASSPSRHFARQAEDLKLAIKLSRTFASLTLALAEQRGKCGHTVTGEHVHIRG